MHGSTFIIYLPRVTEVAEESFAKNILETSPGNNETLLLVEDDAAILKLSERMLKKLGYRVIAANSPLAAIAMAQNYQEPIDLLITDVIMPELNGRDLATRLQGIISGLKVLFMSGYTSDVIFNRGVMDKDVFLLQKPFSKNELASKIREVLTKSQPSDIV
ncbi:MAG: response regulator [Deltaproteobacteria bacterium]|nr:response regulator [Deltaproteobacteria bacterium]